VQRWLAFTLVEIVLAVFILMLLLLLAVPSLSGVLANNRLRRSLNGFNNLVRQAQERSVAERRAYLIVWREKGVLLRPEVFAKGQQTSTTVELKLTLKLPAALTNKPPAEWIFWPSGTCEPATVQFKGAAGSWTANYLPLTARPEVTSYVAR